MIVDDESGIRFALKRWFERQHWTVSEADDGERALNMLLESSDNDNSRIDVIICDLHLPGIGGEEVVRRLASERPELVGRLIITTGDATIDAPADSILATNPHVLQKPFDLSTLREHVSQIQPLG